MLTCYDASLPEDLEVLIRQRCRRNDYCYELMRALVVALLRHQLLIRTNSTTVADQTIACELLREAQIIIGVLDNNKPQN